MQTIRTPTIGSQTFLTRLFGKGLADKRYAVQKFVSRVDGDICPVTTDGSRQGRKARPQILTLKQVRELCPGRDEIIIATGIDLHDSGVQLWGFRSMGLFTERRPRC